MMSAVSLLAVFVGGGLGAAARYLVSALVENNYGSRPLATLFVNISGCLIAGALIGYFEQRPAMDRNVVLLLSVGVLGGYTTFSAFGIDTIALLEAREIKTAILYLAGSVLLSVLAALAGQAATRAIFR